MAQTIDLSVLTQGKVRNLSGHERGVVARREFGLDRLDRSAEEIAIEVPTDLTAISPSFAQGLFAESAHQFGSWEAFARHYKINASPEIVAQIRRGIRSALLMRSTDDLPG
ncbi:hypothetical protein GTQ45_14855 [Pyruvatibacter mobilis]|uniref:DUF4325 domain-containing protein n=1 Tax=Pyruvatibacter mobilis TaxID=1712261 RepID=A0A845QEB7_9HYPH|nr:hypothetical protein [Pyruvatibacter mobilis]NBG97015.1 hypothetical protein [Pyruvatibacter mobilis]QJD74431.1 hypothetical protein HG718_02845 [Pyruvatibacter mobilis]GGD06919.1 hypothetical protein GCM10011587_08570 [Pyruvatibacter mobilis]